MAEELTPDLCVIGGGPGGVAAAIGAANAGIPVVLVEKGRLGGADLWAGSVPAHALRAAASYHETLRRGPAIGVTGAPLQVNFAKVSEHIQSVIAAVATTVSAERLTALGVRVVAGEARFTDRSTVVAGETSIKARRFIIATGSAPAPPALPGLDQVDYDTVDTAFDLSRRPSHLLVLGAGARGLELAQAYNRLGVDATVVDDEPALQGEDPELASAVLDRLKAEGVRVRAGEKIAGFARRRGGIRVTFAEGQESGVVDGSHLLLAKGRAPNIAALNLAAAGIQHDAGGIVVDRGLRTTNHKVHAIGDVVAGPRLAGKAEYQAASLIQSFLAKLPGRPGPVFVPGVTWTDPALATVGLGEAEARLQHRDIQVLRHPFVDNILCEAERTTAGMVKVIADGRGRVVGAGIVGRDAGELIAFWSLAVANRLTVTEVLAAALPYPSRSEAGRRAAAAFRGANLTPGWQRSIMEFLRKFG